MDSKLTSKSDKLLTFIGTGAYSGLSPYAPGTMGSLVGIALFLLFFQYLPWIPYVLSLVGLYAMGVVSARHIDAEKGGSDSQCIVIDEVVGMLLTMLGANASFWQCCIGFALFRFFDVVKVSPANAIQREMKGPHGVMLDDVIAGMYSFIILRILTAIAS